MAPHCSSACCSTNRCPWNGRSQVRTRSRNASDTSMQRNSPQWTRSVSSRDAVRNRRFIASPLRWPDESTNCVESSPRSTKRWRQHLAWSYRCQGVVPTTSKTSWIRRREGADFHRLACQAFQLCTRGLGDRRAALRRPQDAYGGGHRLGRGVVEGSAIQAIGEGARPR